MAEMDASSRRVSCTHASRGRESRKSEISSSGDVDGEFATGLGVLMGVTPTLAAFLGFAAVVLGAAVVLASAFSGFAFFSVAVTWGSLGALVLETKPSQAKVLTEGGDLRNAQVDVPPSGSHTCV